MPTGEARARYRQGGFTYVMVMAAIAILGVGLAVIGPAWADRAQRDREQELLRIGTLYAQAIASYRDNSPGSLKTYPLDLENLTSDLRFVGIRRHLRKVYSDPMDPNRAWGLVRSADGGIQGVYSLDLRTPFILTTIQIDGGAPLIAAQRYVDWIFAPKPLP